MKYAGKKVTIFTATLKATGILGIGSSTATVDLDNAAVTSLIDVQMDISNGLPAQSETFPGFIIAVDAIQAFGEPKAEKT